MHHAATRRELEQVAAAPNAVAACGEPCEASLQQQCRRSRVRRTSLSRLRRAATAQRCMQHAEDKRAAPGCAPCNEESPERRRVAEPQPLACTCTTPPRHAARHTTLLNTRHAAQHTTRGVQCEFDEQRARPHVEPPVALQLLQRPVRLRAVQRQVEDEPARVVRPNLCAAVRCGCGLRSAAGIA